MRSLEPAISNNRGRRRVQTPSFKTPPLIDDKLGAIFARCNMDDAIRKQILDLLDQHRTMSLATIRPDGWPQATTVGYAHEGLSIYFLCGTDSQKAANLARDDRVSLTIDHDTDQVMDIKGLSIAARAKRVKDEAEGRRIMGLLLSRYSEQKGPEMEMPKVSDIAIFAVTPMIISVLDYAKGFGHTELVAC